LSDGQWIDRHATDVAATRLAFAKAREHVKDTPVDRAGLYGLVDLGLVLRRESERADAAAAALRQRAKALDNDLDRLQASEREWEQRLEAARTRNAPPELLQRLAKIPQTDDALEKDVRAYRDHVLDALTQVTDLRAEMAAMRSQIDGRRVQLESQMHSARGAPIWSVEPRPEEVHRMRAFAATEGVRLARYLNAHTAALLTIGGLAFSLTYWLIVATRGRIAREAETDPHARSTAELFRLPGVAAFVVALLALVWQAPPAPVIFYDVGWALLPIPAALLARNLLGTRLDVTLATLAVTVLSLALLGALELLPLLSRLVVILQCSALAVALAYDVRRGGFEQSFPAHRMASVRWAVRAAIVLLGLAVVANVFGYLGLSRTLRNGVVGSLGFGLVFAVTRQLAYGLVLALMQTRLARRLRVISQQPYGVQQAARIGLNFAAVLGWLAGALLAFGLLDDVAAFIRSLARGQIELGTVTISGQGVLAALMVVAATFVLVKAIRLVLEVEILPRLRLKSGVPFAISTIVRYLLVTAGLFLAMAAMGIDLTKVTLLAGALGVGIGFGLQSVVNNFVSGLILLVERPINVGDAIQMQDLWGEVRRIGVRSSTVRTFQGAEVIVPNADLISKEVVNWTLSDRRRRLEIDVGVAYGSDPERVVRVLETAAKSIKDLSDSPAPFAWFTGFGDSSLDFRLQAWIEDYDRGLVIQSALRVAIYNAFKDAEIEIPFPQRDIHIRTGPPNPLGGAAAQSPVPG
ncbi:MAG TPA: mechanosensitive ion channel domain-containing protein, partial [Pelomicrobium sp.]|nr:mechanosensitive ion channel domain-containing protein [Pelomicrobium sp.]